MKRIILALTLLFGVYHMSTKAVEKMLVPRIVEPISIATLTKSEILKQDLSKILARTDRLASFKMAKIENY